MLSFHNVQISKPAITGHPSCQATFAAQKRHPVIAGSTVAKSNRRPDSIYRIYMWLKMIVDAPQ